MKQTQLILVVGRHPQIMESVLRLINSRAKWSALGALTDEQAIAIFNKNRFDLVLIGGGVENQSEQKLKKEFEKISPGVKVIRHYGGSSGLLFNEIEEAMT